MWWTVERNVQAGARLLDEVLPGWHRFVSRCELDAMNIHKDVLGQMFCDSLIGFQMIIKQSHTLQCGSPTVRLSSGSCSLKSWLTDLLSAALRSSVRDTMY